MAGTSPTLLAGHIRTFTNDPATFTDTATGFRNGVSDTLTAFQAMLAATGKWTAALGTTKDLVAYTAGGTVGGPSGIWQGGPGICMHKNTGSGKPPTLLYDASGDGAGAQITPAAFTIILGIRSCISNQQVGDYTSNTDYNPIGPTGSVHTDPAQLILHTNGGGQKIECKLTYNRFPQLIATLNDSTPTTLTGTTRLGSGDELIAFSVSAGVMSIGVLRGNTAQWTTATPGTFDTEALFYFFLSQSLSGNFEWSGAYKWLTICKAGNSHADIESTMVYARDAMLAQTNETFTLPTTQVDIFADSIGGAFRTSNGISYIGGMEAKSRGIGVWTGGWGINGSDASTWAIQAFMERWIDAAPAYSTITKRVLLMFVGANALGTPQATATWKAAISASITQWRAFTGGTDAFVVKPITRGSDADVAACETRAIAYRTALDELKAAGIITGVIDLSQTGLVAAAATATAVAHCCGGPAFQLADNSQHPGDVISDVTNGSWDNTNKLISQTGIATNYSARWQSGDIFVVTAGTGFTPGPKMVGAPNNNDSYTLVNLDGSLFSIANVASGMRGFVLRRREALQMPGTSVFNGRQNGVDALHVGILGQTLAENGILEDQESGFAESIGWRVPATSGRRGAHRVLN